ncbi:ECF transporter S component [Ligilactobacillus apodemi]|uniref:ECF transporter S component n=1 Tax=Ligilactobacillus apodemi TaxID=307126 RepID=UPI00214CF127|nr:ECF transporter S component [Ligilactobacillus apodemi]MCR1901767.1 ECF transporter S component [Ligilactobacillus apodemi]
MKLKQLVTLALIVAVNVVIARVFLIPLAFMHGNINLSDAGIFLAALLYGARSGALVGGLSGFLLDLISGYPQYMLYSLVIHAAQGGIVGKVAQASLRSKLLAYIFGLIVLVWGYFVADSLLYGIQAGLLGIMTNMIQGAVGGAVGFFLAEKLKTIRY